MKTKLLFSLALSMCALSNALAQSSLDAKFQKMMTDGFRAEGIAGLDRIKQDETQKFCSDPKFVNSKQGNAKAIELQKINMASITQPTDGKYIGEDYLFCDRATRAGFKVWVDVEINLPHVGVESFERNFIDDVVMPLLEDERKRKLKVANG